MKTLPSKVRMLLSLIIGITLGVNAVIAAELASRHSVKLLTVGNSFSDNSTRFLPALSKAGGKDLVLFRANLGGHSLQQHVGYIQKFEADPADPAGRPYGARSDALTPQKAGGKSLREILQSERWDVVTIQQVSHLSGDYTSYQPYAKTLIAYIRQHAPQAEFLVHQTWAYPADCPRYQDPRHATLRDPPTMHRKVRAAYRKLATDSGLGVIAVGDAFAAVSESTLPIRLHGKADTHANANGEFLGAAMFYAAIFREPVTADNPFLPPGVTAADALRLREVARCLSAPVLCD